MASAFAETISGSTIYCYLNMICSQSFTRMDLKRLKTEKRWQANLLVYLSLSTSQQSEDFFHCEILLKRQTSESNFCHPFKVVCPTKKSFRINNIRRRLAAKNPFCSRFDDTSELACAINSIRVYLSSLADAIAMIKTTNRRCVVELSS